MPSLTLHQHHFRFVSVQLVRTKIDPLGHECRLLIWSCIPPSWHKVALKTKRLNRRKLATCSWSPPCSSMQQGHMRHRCCTIPCWLKATHVCFLTAVTSACNKLRDGTAKQQTMIVRASLAVKMWDSQQWGQMAASTHLHVPLSFNG